MSVVEMVNDNNFSLAAFSEGIDRSRHSHLRLGPSDGLVCPELETDGGTVLHISEPGHVSTIGLVSKPALQRISISLLRHDGAEGELIAGPVPLSLQLQLVECRDRTESDLREMFRSQLSSRLRGEGRHGEKDQQSGPLGVRD